MRNFLIVINTAILLISCGKKDYNEQVFRYNQETAISSLDPAFARDQAMIWATGQLFNGLVQLSAEMEVIPCLAKRWEITDSGRVYRFFLRSDVYFHDHQVFPGGKGRKLTAKDIEYSFYRIMDPATASPGSWIFNDKVNYSPEKANTEAVLPFEALNDTVFEVRLNKAFPPFLGLLSMPYCFAVPFEAIEKYGRDFRSHPVGTGPFQFTYWEEDVRLVMKKNPNYFEKDAAGNQLPYLDGVMITFIANKQTAFMEFVQGKLDFFNGLEGSYKDELLTKTGRLKKKYEGSFKLSVGPYLNTEYFGFLLDTSLQQNKSNALTDKNLRYAINYAIDREKMLKYLRNNIGFPGTHGFIPRGLPGYNPSFEKFRYNKELAVKYLEKAGYSKNERPQITLYTNPNYLDLTIFIQNSLKEAGINSKIEVNPGPHHREMVSSSKLPFFRGSWLADYPDAENYLALFYSGNFSPGGPNYTHYSNPQYDRLYEQAMKESRDLHRAELYSQMDSILMEDAPVVVLFYDQTIHLTQNNVEGFEENPMNIPVLKKVRKR